MQKNYFNEKCKNHPNTNFNFFCFDDNTFLCDICFKTHRKHNVEVKSELEKYDRIYKSMSKGRPLNKKLEDIKLNLTEIKNDIEKKLLPKINSMLESLNNDTPPLGDNSIFNLSFKSYDNINEFVDIGDSINEITKKLNELKKIFVIYKNFRTINKEVKVIESSKLYEDIRFNFDVMLNKKDGEYTLFNAPNNQYVILEFPKKLFLKNVLISVKQGCDCVPKNFKISVKNENGNFELVNSYVCQDHQYEKDFQEFEVNKEAKTIKLDFLDAWENISGNYILIRRMSFEVSDID